MRGTLRKCLGWAGLLVAGLAQVPSAQGHDPTFAKIEAYRSTASAIVIDGSAGDWGDIPAFPDPVGDATGGADTDIVSVAIAPLDDALLLRIETAAPPPTSFLRFWVEIDFRSEQFRDVEVGLDASFDDLLWIYPEDAAAQFVSPWQHATLAIGNVLEARIPYAALEAVLPASMQGQLSGSAARSWLRVRPYSVGPGGVEDYGAAVASFRLVPTPYPLDPPLPAGSESPVETPFPLLGQQYVSQGAMTGPSRSHAGIWGYDVHPVDNTLHVSDPLNSANNADYYGFGLPILAPLDASVFSLVTGEADAPPGGPAGPVNFVFLDLDGSVGLLFSHAKQDSIPLAPAQNVVADQTIGEIGNSGSASFAHLHYEARQIGGGDPSQPLALVDVLVGLNPVPDDPWQRRVGSWGIREGFFVERAPRYLPAASTAGRLLLVAAIAAAALVRARRRGRPPLRR